MRFSLKALMLLGIILLVGAGSVQAGALIVGCDAGFKPFVFIGPDGTYTGFDIELWDSIAKRLKLDYRLVRMDFKELIPALVDKKIDVALAGITIISQREKQIDFSFPYFESDLRILVRASDNAIADIGDLDQKVVATKQGTTSAKFVKNIQTGQVSLFRTIDEAYRALEKGRVDAVIFDSPSMLNYVNTDGKGIAKIVGRNHQHQHYGFAFQQGSELREKVNIEILKFMEEGYYDIYFRKWFGYVRQ